MPRNDCYVFSLHKTQWARDCHNLSFSAEGNRVWVDEHLALNHFGDAE